MKYHLLFDTDEEGWLTASRPTLSGSIAQGPSRKEAISTMRDAVEGYLAVLRKQGDPIPLPITEEILEVNA